MKMHALHGVYIFAWAHRIRSSAMAYPRGIWGLGSHQLPYYTLGQAHCLSQGLPIEAYLAALVLCTGI